MWKIKLSKNIQKILKYTKKYVIIAQKTVFLIWRIRMNKFRYNDPVERMKRVNGFYLIALIILFGVLIVYQSLLVKAGEFSPSLELYSRVVLIGAVLFDGILFLIKRCIDSVFSKAASLVIASPSSKENSKLKRFLFYDKNHK